MRLGKGGSRARTRFAPLAFALLFAALLAPAGGAPRAGSVEPMAGLRVRQEILSNVYYFDTNEQDRDWIRVRTRLGLRWKPGGGNVFEARLANESREMRTPGGGWNGDELIVDRLAWTWKGGERPFAITLGRQDVVWNDGFLVLDGNPFDGSRSIHQNAFRVVWGKKDLIEVLAVANQKDDPLVIARDEKWISEDRPMRDADERALAIRCAGAGGKEAALIMKREKDPDGVLPTQTNWTFDFRQKIDEGKDPGVLLEIAPQRRFGDAREGWALAAQAKIWKTWRKRTRAEAGCLFYSGEGEQLRAFRTPWGRWPRWSDLYIYSLVGEGGVGLWEDMIGPFAGVTHALTERVDLEGRCAYWHAPEEGESRGILTLLGAKFRIGKGFSGHLLWERFDPGGYYDSGPYCYPCGCDKTAPAADWTETAHFIRWQISYDLN
ncbi:MAG: hypothetical protein JW958_02260 [Candidatus Eisenbacteria bacterium]|nr:hypothetical protein [Candidatus Eisenbacteria bacterium]